MKRLVFFIAIGLLTLSISVYSQIPNKISYQGLLTTPSGAPAPDGSYDLKFEIFNHPSAGTLRFAETQTGVSVVRGTFGVSLGTISTLPAIFSESLYVQVTAVAGPGIGSPLTFLPRSELTSAPYALAPWVPSGNAISYAKGNVGIGTTNPSALLEIKGAEPINGEIARTWDTNASATATSFGGFGVVSSVGRDVVIGKYSHSNGATNDYDAFQLRDDLGNAFLHVDLVTGGGHTSGNVGIGTTNPAHLLHLSRSANDNLSGLFIQNANAGASAQSRIDVGADWSTRFGSLIYDNTLDRINLGGGSGVAGGVIIDAGAITAPIAFQTGGSERMRIDASGKVGIGRAPTDDKLEVQDLEMSVWDPTAFAQGVGGAIAFLGKTQSNGSFSTLGKIQGIKENGNNLDYASALIFSTRLNGGSLAEQMRISSSGNVGIGTASPVARLQLAGVNFSSQSGLQINGTSSTTTFSSDYLTLQMQNTSATTGNYNKFSFVNANGYESAGILGLHVSHGGVTTSQGALVFLTRPNGDVIQERMRIDPVGNVGIGTTSPNLLGGNLALTVSGSGSTAGALELQTQVATATPNATLGYVDFYNGATRIGELAGLGGGATDAGALSFFTKTSGSGFSERMRIDASGNVGVGTSSPQGALDVTSTTGAFIVPRMTLTQRNALTAVNGMIIYNTTDNQFNFYENGSWVTK